MLGTRLFLSYLLLIAVVLVLVLLGLVFFLRDNSIAERQATVRLNDLARTLPRHEATRRALNSLEELRVWANRLAAETGVRVLVYSAHGDLLADSEPAPAHALTFPTPASAAPPPAGATARRGERLRDAGGSEWLVVDRSLGANHWLVLALPRPQFSALAFVRNNLLIPLVQAGLVALALSLILAVLIARWTAGPLQRMARAARAVAGGHVEVSVPLEGPSEVRELADAFNQMASQVKQGQQTRRDFVANVSHELKTPLTSIQGFAQAIMDGTAEGTAGQRRAASVIYEEADRLRRLVDGLLMLARLDADQTALVRGPVELQRLLENLAERMAPQAVEKGIRLKTEIQPLPGVVGDGDRLAQVVTNLLDNALRHTPSGGKVTLAAGTKEGQIEVTVTDTGPGIPPEDLPRIFERFYQVDKSRARTGAGLGLAISHEIAAAHGGRLTAESVVGLGSKFILRLPPSRPDDTTLVRRRR